MVDNIKEKESYEQAFYNFEPQFIAHMTEQDIDYLMKFPNIIHNQKVRSNCEPSEGIFKN